MSRDAKHASKDLSRHQMLQMIQALRSALLGSYIVLQEMALDGPKKYDQDLMDEINQVLDNTGINLSEEDLDD